MKNKNRLLSMGELLARINIDDSIYRDIRFITLMQKLGSVDCALGVLVRTWSLAQRFYLNMKTGRLIPLAIWKQQMIPEAVIEVGLAERRENGIYVVGSEEQFAWLIQCQEAGKKGGRPPRRTRTLINRSLTGRVRAKTSYSYSSSSSSEEEDKYMSNSSLDVIELNKLTQPDLNSIYREYPRHEGKGAGMKLAQKLKPEDLVQLRTAVRNYKARKQGNAYEHLLLWSTFMRHWRDWLDEDHGNSKTDRSAICGIGER